MVDQLGRIGRCKAVLLALAACLVALPAQAATGVRLLLRYDDYSATSPMALERRLFDGLAALQAPLLVAVVPFPGEVYPPADGAPHVRPVRLAAEKEALLREHVAAGRVEVALHGFNHQSNSVVDGRPSEFAGLSLERQRQLLALGKAGLEQALGLPVRTFTPPYNTFDATTVRALRETGFTVLSAGVTPAENAGRLALVPGTVYPQGLKETVQRALRSQLGEVLIVVVMHPYDFAGSGADMPAFRKRYRDPMSVEAFLQDVAWARAQPGARFVSAAEELARGADLSAGRVDANVALRNVHDSLGRLLPAFLQPPQLDGLLLGTGEARRLRWALYARAGLVAIALFAAAYLASRRLARARWFARTVRVQRVALAAAVPAVLVLGVVQGFYFLKLVALLAATGWWLGIRRVATV